MLDGIILTLVIVCATIFISHVSKEATIYILLIGFSISNVYMLNMIRKSRKND
ncbi:hypothetical protein [Sutcliffiella rhizosphaerae]|uniref:Uncharacterized protein n=1 Tax=Sutcliffiella rhizosphaerae TaxID=2880967 RepID=A0ABM8YMY3_9BACI|nr:hypothetical protein [Sutcliffiella rhizosphaerae]CAG9621249.1 hypothetical protein BACCIP111883_02021 [Sutcliffiella rhizosphaerae]